VESWKVKKVRGEGERGIEKEERREKAKVGPLSSRGRRRGRRGEDLLNFLVRTYGIAPRRLGCVRVSRLPLGPPRDSLKKRA
jgi:hypothetical protein